jgi:hypothetical protein
VHQQLSLYVDEFRVTKTGFGESSCTTKQCAPVANIYMQEVVVQAAAASSRAAPAALQQHAKQSSTTSPIFINKKRESLSDPENLTRSSI